MFRFASAVLCALLFLAPGNAFAQDVIPSPLPSSKTEDVIRSSETHSVPVGIAQKGINRVTALYEQKKEVYRWIPFVSATAAIRSFLADRDPKALSAITTESQVSFNVFDVDADGTSDLIVRYNSYAACANNPTGCPFVIYFADKSKKPTIYNARKMVPVEGGVLLHNEFYSIFPKGGENFLAVSLLMFDPFSAFDIEKLRVAKEVQKSFPEYYALTRAAPGFQYVKHDLNLDGQPEFIAFVANDDGEFDLCEKDGSGSCPVLVYSPRGDKGELKLIGRFNALHQRMVFARTERPGYAEMITLANGSLKGMTVAYAMDTNEGRYVLEK